MGFSEKRGMPMSAKPLPHRSRVTVTLFLLGLVAVGLYGATLLRFSAMMGTGGP